MVRAKMKNKTIAVVSLDAIEDCIYFVRGQKVMLDRDLALLYGVETFNLNKAVRRNKNRFPEDFMFPLTREEYHSLRFQIGILKRGRHSKYMPLVFTQEGVAMLSGILHSSRAVEVNVAIMRAFVRMRQMLSANHELAKKLEELENKLIAHDYRIGDIVKAIRKLMHRPRKPRPRIGF